MKDDFCEKCVLSEIVDWVQNTKTGKAKPVYWCEKEHEYCSKVIDCKKRDLCEVESEG